jgi:hypothetical protein
MDLVRIISSLRQERDRVDEVIAQLERLTGIQQGAATNGTGKTRKPFSDATKRKMAAAQRKRWEAHRNNNGA